MENNNSFIVCKIKYTFLKGVFQPFRAHLASKMQKVRQRHQTICWEKKISVG
jgi:hypothetical protein